jgi:hypothetical protein
MDAVNIGADHKETAKMPTSSISRENPIVFGQLWYEMKKYE